MSTPNRKRTAFVEVKGPRAKAKIEPATSTKAKLAPRVSSTAASKKSSPSKSSAKPKLVPSKPAHAPLSPAAQKRLLGAHTSIGGGVSQAIGRAVDAQFNTAQIFVKSNKQWMAAPLAAEEIAAFKRQRQEAGLFVFAHNSYLINLGSSNPEIRAKSIAAMIAELERCQQLDLPFLVMHPGAHGGDGRDLGLERIAAGIAEVIAGTPKVKTKIAIENTAGQGTCLGCALEDLAHLLKAPFAKERLGVCIDTAHLFAAGFDLRTAEAYEDTFAKLDKIVGRKWLLAFHLNDSKVPLNARVDRHANLGEGHIGWDAFHRLLADPRYAHIPMVLETPKSEDMHEDTETLTVLRAKL